MTDLSATARMVPAVRLRQFAEIAFELVGCSPRDSAEAANVLMWASLRGVDTHGIRNLYPLYLQRIQADEVNSRPQIITQNESPAVVRIDGGGGLGLVTAGYAMRLAMQKAKDVGVGMATVENSSHLGPAGYFASMGLDAGLLGICVTGTFFGSGNRIGVAPINTTRAMFSTNPVSFAAPAGRRPAFVLDMSTTAATVNRIEMFGQAGRQIPAGWAKDADGNVTVDPQAACVLHALGGDRLTGGHKGVALSMMVSILSGVLAGGWQEIATATESKYEQGTPGHFLAAIRIDQFMPVEEFKTSIDTMLDAILACPPIDGNEPIQYPGSREHETYENRLRDGIPLDQRLLEELERVGSSMSIPVSL